MRSPEAFAGQLGDPPSLAEEELKLAESLRCYRGQTLEVKVLARGFEYEDRIYGSPKRK